MNGEVFDINGQNIVFEYDYSDRMMTEKEAKQVFSIERSFLKSYAEKESVLSDEEWLKTELSKQLPEKSQDEISEITREVIISLQHTENEKKNLEAAIKKGRSKENWFASTIGQYASLMATDEANFYLQRLDDSVKYANEEMLDAITKRDGGFSMNPNLDGFIAEQYHVNTYNLKADAVGGKIRAEVLKPLPGEKFAKNSVDVVLKDEMGKIVQRYQAKYGATSEQTIKYIKDGNYRGQRLLVPAEQVEEVQKAFPDRKVQSVIGEGDITSKPLTKEEVKQMQKDAQRGNFLEVDWNEFSSRDIAIGVAKNIGYASLQGAAVGAGMNILGQAIKGEKIDGEEVIETAVESGADFGVKAAVAGALKTASEKGIAKVIPKGTPAATFANIAFVAVENMKVAGKVAKGEYTLEEGIDKMEQTTVACAAGIATSVKGAAVGVTIGAVFGPVGAAVGGFAGSVVGYMAGSKVGETVVRGAQKVRKKAREVVTKAAEKVSDGIKSVAGRVFGGLRSIFA